MMTMRLRSLCLFRSLVSTALPVRFVSFHFVLFLFFPLPFAVVGPRPAKVVMSRAAREILLTSLWVEGLVVCAHVHERRQLGGSYRVCGLHRALKSMSPS